MANKKFQSIIKELLIRCRKLNISLVFITKSYFSIPKVVRLNSTPYLIMKTNNKRELQNIAINHFAHIDYKEFLKINREYIKEPFNFLTMDTMLPGTDPLRFKKICFNLIKMTVTDQIKVLNCKIKENEAQYNLDRKSAKISAFSNNLGKYEYLTGDDLGFKPSTVKEANFAYFLLRKIFNKGLDKD